MKVKTPEMLEKMRARMKKARKARSLKNNKSVEFSSPTYDGKCLKPEDKLISHDSVYYTVVRVEGGLYVLRSIEIKGGRIVKEEAGVPNVFGVPMGTIITALEDKFS